VTALIAAVTWWRAHETGATVAAVVAAVLIAGGLWAPAALCVPNRIWWRFAQALGWVNARIVLSAFFFLVLTPAGFLMRTFGRNPLVPADPGTAWSRYASRRKDPKHYEHPY
jgi:hypothetical protein